jgi:hypothetical protein
MVLMKSDMLDPMRLGWAYAIIFSAVLLWLGVLSTTTKYAAAFVIIVSPLFPGYANTLPGSLAGFLWGLVDGFLFGWIQARIYNVHAHQEMQHLAKNHPQHIARIHEQGWLPASGRKKKR